MKNGFLYITFATVKKIISISLLIIFMLQALPVTHWFNSLTDNYFTVEMNDDAEKEDCGKNGAEKEFKIKHSPENYISSFHIILIKINLNILTSENAVILHHAEVCTPPPNFG
jgi:hypothetical protein